MVSLGVVKVFVIVGRLLAANNASFPAAHVAAHVLSLELVQASLVLKLLILKGKRYLYGTCSKGKAW